MKQISRISSKRPGTQPRTPLRALKSSCSSRLPRNGTTSQNQPVRGVHSSSSCTRVQQPVSHRTLSPQQHIFNVTLFGKSVSSRGTQKSFANISPSSQSSSSFQQSRSLLTSRLTTVPKPLRPKFSSLSLSPLRAHNTGLFSSSHASNVRKFANFPNPTVDLTEEQIMLRDTALKFAQDHFEPHAAEWDQKEIFPVEALRQSGELGFGGIYTADDVGGSGLSRLDASLIFEALSTCDVSTTAYLSIHNMCCGLIDTFGTQEQRQQFLPDLVSMKKFSSYCLTEPGSGSDAAALITRAEKKGDYYLVNGTKAFISGGGDSDVYLVMVRTGDNSPKGISCLLIEKGTPGLSFGGKEKKMGWNSQPTRAVILEDAKIPTKNLIGKEGEGFKIAMKALDGGRVNIAACSIGGAQRALDDTVSYLKNRKAFGTPLATNQALQFQLAEFSCSLRASRMMVRDAAKKLDEEHPEKTLAAASAKLFACDSTFQLVDQCLQMHGGYGYLKDYPIERILRDIRVHRILEGTDAVMKLILARQLFKE